MSGFDDQLDELPDALVHAMKSGLGKEIRVPPEVDRAILSRARARLARMGRLNLLLRWGGGIGAAAAMVLFGIYLGRSPAVSPSAVSYQVDDINRDGRVDMIDAYLLARRLRGGEKVAQGLDLNGDGMVDDKDVEALANRAVSLEGGVVK